MIRQYCANTEKQGKGLVAGRSHALSWLSAYELLSSHSASSLVVVEVVIVMDLQIFRGTPSNKQRSCIAGKDGPMHAFAFFRLPCARVYWIVVLCMVFAYKYIHVWWDWKLCCVLWYIELWKFWVTFWRLRIRLQLEVSIRGIDLKVTFALAEEEEYVRWIETFSN